MSKYPGKVRFFVVGLALALLAVGAAITIVLGPPRLGWTARSNVVTSSPELEVTHTGTLEGADITGITKDLLYAAQGRNLYAASHDASELVPVGAYSGSSLVAKTKRLVTSSRLLAPVLQREGADGLNRLKSGTILVMYFDGIYRSTDGGASFELVQALSLDSPGPYSHAAAVADDDKVYYGEFIFETPPRRWQIWRGTDDGRKWDVAYTYPPGVSLHVHAVTFDRYRNRLWVTTGCDAKVSQISYTDDDFKTLQLLGGGDYTWRTMDVLPTKDALYWGTWDNVEPSHIYRYDFQRSTREAVFETENPIWYTASLADGTITMATAYEPKTTFTKKYSPPKRMSVLASRDGRHWVRALSIDYEADPSGEPFTGTLTLDRANEDASSLYLMPRQRLKKNLQIERYRFDWR